MEYEYYELLSKLQWTELKLRQEITNENYLGAINILDSLKFDINESIEPIEINNDIKPIEIENGEYKCSCGNICTSGEEGEICYKCYKTYFKCQHCYNWCVLLKWGINNLDKNTQFKPSIYESDIVGDEIYVDDGTIFLYKCINCNILQITHCD